MRTTFRRKMGTSKPTNAKNGVLSWVEGRAKFKEADVRRILNAARKAGVHVRIDFCDGGIVATTVDEAMAKPNMSADDELENWRRKKRHEDKT